MKNRNTHGQLSREIKARHANQIKIFRLLWPSNFLAEDTAIYQYDYISALSTNIVDIMRAPGTSLYCF